MGLARNSNSNYGSGNRAGYTHGPITQVRRPAGAAAGMVAGGVVSWVTLLDSRAWVRFDRRRLPVPDREGRCVGGSGRRSRCRGEGSADHGPARPDVHGLCRRSRSLVLAPRRRPERRLHRRESRSGRAVQATQQRVGRYSWCLPNGLGRRVFILCRAYQRAYIGWAGFEMGRCAVARTSSGGGCESRSPFHRGALRDVASVLVHTCEIHL